MSGHGALRRLISSPMLSASAALHAGAAGAALWQPSIWPWALGVVVANHGLLTGAGLWPKSRWLGPNWVALPMHSQARGEVAITIDDGPDPAVTPRVLAQLANFGANATFFCVGERIRRHPQLAREILRLGHVIENHSQRHRHDFSLLGPKRMRREIADAQDSIAQVTGTMPVFFRAPAGLRNPFLQPLLEDLQLRLASWTRRGFDTVSGDAEVIYKRLSADLAAGDILLLHDANCARGPRQVPVILEVLPRLLEKIRSRHLTPVTLRAALAAEAA